MDEEIIKGAVESKLEWRRPREDLEITEI